jgi:HflK protein
LIEKAAQEIIYIFNESAIYILFGFLIAGILKVTVSTEKITKHLGGNNFRSVFLASILGIPLPLCSCAVLPTAISLRRQGASKGSTLSFLISTPETGIDSISITYALIDPVMTVFRPVAALITAVTAGIFANHFKNKLSTDGEDARDESDRAIEDVCACETHEDSRRGKINRLLQYAFVDLLDDIVFWLIIGIVIAGFISAALPDNFFKQYLSGFSSMLVMFIIGIPIYMCAASSTPVAAAMILKGLNPGAALVFLLAGPATNIGTIAAVGRFLGKKMMVIYLGTIIVTSIYLGVILNIVYASVNINPTAVVGRASELMPASLKVAGSLTLLFLIIRNLWKTGFENALRSLNDKLNDFTGFRIRLSEKYLDPLLKYKESLVKQLPVIVIALYLLSGLNSIQPGETGVLKRFGKVISKDLGPGLHYILPYPVDTLIRVKPSYVRKLSFLISSENDVSNKNDQEGMLMLTGDENIVDARFTIHYRIKNSYDYLFSASESERLLKFYSRAAIVETIGRKTIDNIITTGRSALEGHVMDTLQTQLDRYSSGIQILSVRLIYSHSPKDLHFAFRDVASAAEDKNTKINEAQEYRNNTLSMAKGEAEKILVEAKAYKIAKTNSASGAADAFLLQAKEFGHAEDITKTRLYIETMEKVLPGIDKIVKPVPSSDHKYDFWFLNKNNTGAETGIEKNIVK